MNGPAGRFSTISASCGSESSATDPCRTTHGIAAKLNWPDTYQAEYIALTQLQAGALVTADRKLASAARAFVETVSPADILRP